MAQLQLTPEQAQAELDRRRQSAQVTLTPAQAQAELDRRSSHDVKTEGIVDSAIPVRRQIPQGVTGGARARGTLALLNRPDPRIEAPESSEGRQRSAADRGIDFRTGTPFSTRVKMAVAPGFRTAQKEAAAIAFRDEISAAAESGQEFLRWDEDLGDLVFRRNITQEDVDAGLEKESDIGKARWTALNAAGFDPGDLGLLFDLPEIGSVVGAAATAGRASGLKFTGAVGTQAAGGLAGRELGNIVEIAGHIARGGSTPTTEELIDMGMTDIGIEVLGSFLGETASRAIIQPLSRKVQTKAAEFGVGAQPSQAASDAADVAQEINDTTTKGTFAPSVGEALDSPEQLVTEASRIRNATPARRQQEAVRRMDEKRAFNEFVEAKFAGDPHVSRADVIREANTTIKDGASIHIGTTVVDGSETIHVFPGAGAASGEGLEIKARGGDTWQIVNANMDNLKGLGLGKQSYLAAAEEARDRGVKLTSDSQVSEDAVSVWQSIDGSPEVGKLRWNVDPSDPANYVDGNLVSDAMRPVVEVVPETSTAKALLAESKDVFRAEKGRFTTRFNDFMSNPNRTVLGQVGRDVNANPYVKQDFLGAMFEHYNKVASPKGNFSHKAHLQWIDEHEGILAATLSPEELSRIRVPGAFRSQVDALARSNDGSRSVLSRVLRVSQDAPVLRDNNQLVNQVARMTSNERKKVFRILEGSNPDQLKAVRGVIRENIADKLRSTFSGGATATRSVNYNKWLKDNRDWFQDAFGAQYVRDLSVLGKGLQIASRRSGVTGAAEEATPGVLGLFRAVFGPLSRKQRFITAGRRTQVRAMGENSINVVTDPAVLRSVIEIKDFPIQSNRTMSVLARLGVLEALGTEDPEEVVKIAKELVEEARLDEEVGN